MNLNLSNLYLVLGSKQAREDSLTEKAWEEVKGPMGDDMGDASLDDLTKVIFLQAVNENLTFDQG